MEHFPTPAILLAADEYELVEVIATASRAGYKFAKKKAEALIKAAEAAKVLDIHSCADESMILSVICYSNPEHIVRQCGILGTVDWEFVGASKNYSQKRRIAANDSRRWTTFCFAYYGRNRRFRRFKNKKALVAFAGVDAPPFQSGTFESKSRHVSKRGSPHPRRTLFIISSVILQLSHEDNPVFCFMDKKRSEGKHFYVYMVAGAAKFLRIYYATVTGHFKASK